MSIPPIVLVTEIESPSFSSWRFVVVSLVETCALPRCRKATATNRVWGIEARVLPIKLVAEA